MWVVLSFSMSIGPTVGHMASFFVFACPRIRAAARLADVWCGVAHSSVGPRVSYQATHVLSHENSIELYSHSNHGNHHGVVLSSDSAS